jgi:hypothetical protein
MEKYSQEQLEIKKKILFLLISTFGFLIFAYFSGECSLLKDFSLVFNLVSCIFALVVGSLALVRFYTKKTKLTFFVLGLGFVVLGILEAFKVLSLTTTFTSIFHYTPEEFFPLSGVLSRSFTALIFFLSYIVARDYENVNSKREKGIALLIVSIFVVLISFFVLFTNVLSGYQQYLPAVVGGILSMLMMSFSIFGYLRGKVWRYEALEYWTIVSISFALLSTIFFLPFLNLEYDLMMGLSSLAMLLSYIFLFIGFLMSIYEVYQRESEDLKKLKEANKLLLKSKSSVEEAYLKLRTEKMELVKNQSKKGKNED